MAAIDRTDLLRALVDPAREVREVIATRIDLAPGAGAGLHTHPCPVAGVVLEGRVRYRVDGEELQVLGSGDAFYEPADRRIREFTNASTIHAASFVAFYLATGSEDTLIELLDG